MSSVRSASRFWSGDSPALIVTGRVVVVALGLASAPIIARAIGPTGRGETATSAALFYIVPIILAMGVPLEVRRRVALESGSPILRTVRLYSLMLAPAALAIAWTCYETVFSSFDQPARLAAATALTLAPLSVSWMCTANAFLARGQLRRFFIIQVVQPSIYLVFVASFWWLGIASTATVVAASGAATLATFITASALSRARGDGTHVSLREMLRGGVKFSGAAIAEALVNRLDQVLAVPLLGAAQAGIYSVAVTIGAAPIAFAHALGARYFTLVAQASEAGPQELALAKGRAARASLSMGLVVALVLAAVTPLAVPLVFGAQFESAVLPTLVMLGGSVAMTSAFVCSLMLAASGGGLRMTGAQVVAAVTNVLLLLVLGPSRGAMGAAAASSMAYLTLLVLTSGLLRLTPRDWRLSIDDFRRAATDLLGRRGTPGAPT